MSNPRTAQLVSGERLPSPADRSCRDLEYVSRGVRSFIRIGAGLGGEVADFVANGGFYRACVITDDHVARLHGAELRACLADAGGPVPRTSSLLEVKGGMPARERDELRSAFALEDLGESKFSLLRKPRR
ncbi:MAG TPA: hypothetical protein VHG32_06340 [Thermoanaerobaculia bacterium]|jgi:hypothetical protein|nr:hypothetical protein [Thermoanaerobaculia bacterium]